MSARHEPRPLGISLPRRLLSRIIARAIERLDEIDGDPDLEGEPDREDDTEDCCLDEDVERISGPTVGAQWEA